MQIETSNSVLTGGFDISNDDSILNESASTNQLPDSDINAGMRYYENNVIKVFQFRTIHEIISIISIIFL